MMIYSDMLSTGEHIILDIEHFLLFLKIVNNNDEFWETHKAIARSHSDQIGKKMESIDIILKRLEICNFLKIKLEAPDEYIMLFGSDIPKKFVKVFLEEFCKSLNYNIVIKEGLTKFRLKVNRDK